MLPRAQTDQCASVHCGTVRCEPTQLAGSIDDAPITPSTRLFSPFTRRLTTNENKEEERDDGYVSLFTLWGFVM